MQSVNNPSLAGSALAARQQIARLAALTLIFSYAELMLPRVVPFFRLGLGNAALLMGLALDLSFPAFMLLAVVKAVASNLMAGTLFSPFFLVSFAQSLVSALIMFGLWRVSRAGREGAGRRLLSLYGISVCGAAASALVQIALSSLYLGQGTWALLGPMLLFNLMSGFITAWIAEILGASDKGGEGFYSEFCEAKLQAQVRCSNRNTEDCNLCRPRNAPGSSHPVSRARNIICLTLILAAAASVFFIKNTAVLCVILLLSFLAQKISGRKILLLPHISLWLFVLLTSIFVPNGRVLFSFAGFSFTEGAALSAIQKALRLSIVSALSQTAAIIKLTAAPDSLLTLTLDYYSAMSDTFRNTPGSVISKIKAALR